MLQRCITVVAGLALLAACAQAPEVSDLPPATPVPTQMSTDLLDSALKILPDGMGGSYVLGYRNESPSELGRGEVYASHVDNAGLLKWLTVLPSDGLLNGRDNLFLSSTVSQGSLYVTSLTSTHNVADAKPVILHKLDTNGKLLRSHEIIAAANGIIGLIAAPSGQLYLQHGIYGPDNSRYQSRLLALDPDGRILWEREENGYPLATTADSSVYVSGYRTLLKYSAEGDVLWTRDVLPSIPGFTENSAPEAGPFWDVKVVDDGFYLTMDYEYGTPDGPETAAQNSEVRRYDEAGTLEWSKFLFPERTGIRSTASLPIGVNKAGSLFVFQQTHDNVGLPGANVLRFSSDGTQTATALASAILSSFFPDGTFRNLTDVDLTTTTVDGAETTAFYAAGSTGSLPCQVGPCPLPDAFLSLFAINEAASPDELYVGLLWSVQ